MAKIAKQFDVGLILEPQSSDPVSPVEGQIQRSDGSVRTEGLWEYKNGAWTAVSQQTAAGDVNQNYLINGDFSLAQRGTSFAAIATSSYSLDRMRYTKTGTMVHTVSQDTDVPTFAQSGQNFSNSLLMTLTTPDTSIATNDFCLMEQYIEGLNYANVHKKTVTISFWVKATLTGIYCIALRNSAVDRSYVAEYTINSADTWEQKSITVTLDQSGTWLLTSGVGLRLSWTLVAGSDFHATNATWGAGSKLSTSNQVNGVNTGSTSFRLSGIKLNLGDSPTPFSLFGKTIDREIGACQRYFQKSYSQTIAPGTASTVGSWSMTASTTTLHVPIYFHTKMRATPTIVQYSPTTGASGQIRDNTGGADVAAATQNTGEGLLVAGANSITDTRLFSGQWTATAEL